MLSSNISFRCPHNMVNVDPIKTAEIVSGVWCTTSTFNGFRVLASLLQRRHSLEANQTLHDVWPSPRLVHYLYIFGALATRRNFATYKIHFASKVLRSPILATLLHMALEQRALAKICSVIKGMELRNFRIWRHLYWAGRSLRWASAHILVWK